MSGIIAPGSSATRSAASDSIWWRQIDDNPTRRMTAAVSPVSCASMPQHGIGVADQPLAAHVGTRADEQLRAQAELPAVAVDEPEIAERAEVPVDGRDGHLQQGTQVVRSDFASVGNGQQQAEAAREGGVFRRLFGWAVPRRGHRPPACARARVRPESRRSRPRRTINMAEVSHIAGI